MLKSIKVTSTQIALTYNGVPVGSFRSMSSAGWAFTPRAGAVLPIALLREITERLAVLSIEGAS